MCCERSENKSKLGKKLKMRIDKNKKKIKIHTEKENAFDATLKTVY